MISEERLARWAVEISENSILTEDDSVMCLLCSQNWYVGCDKNCYKNVVQGIKDIDKKEEQAEKERYGKNG